MNENLIIKDSEIHGKGIFALRNFKKGEIINKWDTSNIFNKDNIVTLSDEERKHISYIGGGNFILLNSPERYVNHSCNPNAYVKDCCEVAIKDINNGEEITSDYSLEGVNGWEFECNCGSNNCRGTVYGDFNKLDTKDKNRLKPFLQEWYVKEVLDKN